MSTIEIETDDNFESCNDCIHCDDTEEICKKRRCIHAIDIGKIRECYAPKEQYIPLDKVKKVREKISENVYRYSGTGEEVLQGYCDGFNYCLKLIDNLIESEE